MLPHIHLNIHISSTPIFLIQYILKINISRVVPMTCDHTLSPTSHIIHQGQNKIEKFYEDPMQFQKL